MSKPAIGELAAGPVPEKLPAWRLIAAVFILGGMVVVLLLLAPVYIDNTRLGWYVRDLVRAPEAAVTDDETLRNRVLARARQLDLPVEQGDVRIIRSAGTLRIETKYGVVKDFRLYQVDLHFDPGSTSNSIPGSTPGAGNRQ